MPVDATRTEVLVVGGGLAGLVAASRTAELGVEVVLLDKGGSLGDGNTLTTSGTFYTAGVPANSSADELYSRVMSGGAAHPETAQAWAENCGRALRWLESIGISIDRTGDGPPRLESNSTVSMAPVYRVDVGTNVIKKLRAFLQARHGITSSKTKVVKLLSKRRIVVGAEAIDEGGRRKVFLSYATILATGGFQANRELLKKHIGRHADQCKLMGSATATGDGLKMALDLGARVVNLNYFYGRLVSLKALTDDRFWPYPTLDTLIEDGILVDKFGKRFRDEGWGDTALANHVSRWNEITGACLIFDEVAWERSRLDKESVVPPNPWLLEKEGFISKADSVAELAVKLGINGKSLEATVEEFNMAATKRRLGELVVPRINHPGPMKPPFYGLKVTPGIISTMGGPLVNRRMNVVDRNGSPIEGLYAAGDVIGGLMGGPNGGYIGGIAQAAVTGLVAGESAQKFASMKVPLHLGH